MNFQIPTTTTAAAGTNFSFGLQQQQQQTQAGSLAAAPKPTFGSIGGGDASGNKPLNFGVAAANTAASTAVVAPTPAFGAPVVSAPTLAAQTTSSFNFGAPAAKTAASIANTQPTATSQPSLLNLIKTTPQALGAAPPTATTTMSGQVGASGGGGGFANLSTATKTTDSAAVNTATQLSYNQLEEHINKWTLELEEQEKTFTDQATQINAWDKVLIGNNKQIMELNDAVQKVKADQQTLEQELEFIGTQHKELEESIIPLQKNFMNIPPADVERSLTYMLVENLDTQLKQMSEDLKEIIDNLNESNKGQDNTDPIIQIGKILNAHMSSLQWIESSSSNICNKLEDLSKMHENFKRESERSFRSAYYN